MSETLAKEIEKRTGFETRTAVIGHMQRGGTPTTFDRILGTKVGVKAAENITAAGTTAGTITMAAGTITGRDGGG